MMSDKDKLRMALAEAGYPDPRCVGGTESQPTVVMSGEGMPPVHVAWKAFKVVFGDDVPCLPCYLMDLGDECVEEGCRADEWDEDWSAAFPECVVK